MNVNAAFPSQYLKAADLGDAEPAVEIARVELVTIGRDRESKLVLFFVGKAKGLVVNRTIAKKIAELVGSPETDDWIGHTVRLYTTTADFAGETFEVIRVKAATPARPPAPTPRPSGVIRDASDIPF